MIKYLYIIVLALFIISCEKKETPIVPFDRGGIVTNTISIVENNLYTKQVFYDLTTNNIVKTIDRSIWDLAFDTKENGTTIRLNSANFMTVLNTYETDFSAVNSTGSPIKYDHSSGNKDSIALKDWISSGTPSNFVFIIDRGQNPIPIGSVPNPAAYKRGFKKIQVLAVTPNSYTIKYANINGSNEHTLIIPKDTTKNNTCFSFDNNGEIVDVEPSKNTWDLLFTRYTTYAQLISSGAEQDYLVTGVLINKEQGIKATKINNKDYLNISIQDVANYPLNDSLDVIGYDWKLFDDIQDSYSINPSRSYLIKDKYDFLYKLRFTDFYNDNGVRGHSSFEFQKL